MTSFGEAIRCPHCLEELEYLIDPKQLPCSHTFCMPCLESLTVDRETGVEVTCSICSAVHKVLSLTELLSPESPMEVDNKNDDDTKNTAHDQNEPSTHIQCDKCKGDTVNAVCFCVNCNKKMCSHHEQAHNDFFDDEDEKHQILSIQVYSSKPNFYKRENCDMHDKEYAMCCGNCYELACSRCNDSGCKAEQEDMQHQHIYLTLEQMAIRLKSEFEDLIMKCSDKITNMCRSEKENWIKLDELEEDCGILVRQVEIKADNLIETIKMELNRVRNMIRAHEKEGKDRIERYLHELREEREDLEGLKAENSQFLLQNNVIEIISNRAKRMKLLQHTSLAYSSDFSIPAIELVKGAITSFMELDVRVVPQHLQLLSSHKTDDACYAANFCKDGKLLIACHDGIMIYSSDMNHVKTLELGPVTAISSQGEGTDCFFVKHHNDRRVVGKTSSDLSGWQKVFEYEYKGNAASHLAISPEFMVCIAHESVVIRNQSTKITTVQKLTYDPKVLCFDSDNNLLIRTLDELRKYSLNDAGRLTLMWTCADLVGAGGIALTRYGDIVVKCGREKKLHIISPQGKLLHTMTHEALTDTVSPIDIHGDILIEPCWDGDKFNRYLIS